MRYKGILMDADDTLFDFQAGNRVAVAALLDEIGYDHPDRYEQYEEINLACWAALERGELTQDQVRLARFRRFFRAYGIGADPEAASRRFVTLLGQQSVLLPGAEEALRAIAAHKPVWLLTNGITAVQKSRLARSAIRDVVSGMIVSQEVGVMKPFPGIFTHALERMGLSAREALVIGDSPTSDIRGANNAGIDACWYNPHGKALPEGVHAEYTVTDVRRFVPIALQ